MCTGVAFSGKVAPMPFRGVLFDIVGVIGSPLEAIGR
jgi:hypothetical protein